jgi:hypothetical protein
MREQAWSCESVALHNISFAAERSFRFVSPSLSLKKATAPPPHSVLPHKRKNTALFEGTPTSSACSSESNYVHVTTSFIYMGKDNRSTRSKPCSIGSLSTINLARTAPESNPVLRGERLSTSRLNHCRTSSFQKEWRYLRLPLHLANSDNEEHVVSN